MREYQRLRASQSLFVLQRVEAESVEMFRRWVTRDAAQIPLVNSRLPQSQHERQVGLQ